MAKTYEIYLEEKYYFAGRQFICAYCGDIADTIDHTVPRSHVIQHYKSYRAYVFQKVPCCKHCNSILGAFLVDTFMERRKKIKDYLNKKYKKQLAALVWDEEEMEELGHNLRTKIESNFAVGKHISARIRFLSLPVPPPEIQNDLFVLKSSRTKQTE